MATIEKRISQDGAISFRVKVRLKGYPVQSETFLRLTDAKRWASSTESAIREGRYFEFGEARRHTLAELIKKYRSDVLPRLRSGGDRLVQLDWWEKRLGPYFLSDVRPAVIIEARKELFEKPTPRGKSMSEPTVNRYVSALSAVFTWGVKELQWMSDNPCFKIQSFKESPGVVRFLSDEERAALLDASKHRSHDLYAIVIIALSSGARRNEILSLKWSDVDFKLGLLTFIKTKNGTIRRVPITGAALSVLREVAAERKLKDRDGLVFPGRTQGTAQKPLAIENIFRAALKDAGISSFRFHDLRHSAASYLVMAGVDIRTVAEILGHSDLKMTHRYSHLSRAHISDAVSKLDSVIFGG